MSRPAPSIRSRLTRGAILAAGLVITAGSTGAYLLTKRDIYRQLDAALIERAEVIEGKSGVFFGRPVLWGKTGEFGQPPPPDQHEIYGAFHLARTDGQTVAAYPVPAPGEEYAVLPRSGATTPYTTTMPDGTPVRAVERTFAIDGLRDPRRCGRGRDRERERDGDRERDRERDGDGEPHGRSGPADDREPRRDDSPPPRVAFDLSLVATRDLSDTHATLGQLRIVLASAGIGTFLALAISINWIVSRSLAPVHGVTAELAARDAANLDTPLAKDATLPAEITPLVSSVNTLLARIRETHERERRFASNAAHELRTPLAALTARLENTARAERDPATYADAIEKSLHTTRSMSTLVAKLLELARLDNHQVTTESAPTPLLDAARHSTAAFTELASGRGVDFAVDIPADLQVETDPALFQAVCDNLVENAASYADPGSTVHVSASPGTDTVTLQVSNPCATTLNTGDAGHVFDPFWRADQARTGTTDHAGLGLSITQKITAILGGSITAQAEDGAFTVRLSLPA